MNYDIAIQSRKSTRDYVSKKVTDAEISEIKAYYEKDCMRLIKDIQTELVIMDRSKKDALENAAGYQKSLEGEPEYMILLSEKADNFRENAGYIMEDLVLKLTDMGLGTCWITYTDSDKIKAAAGIDSPLEVGAVVAFGNGAKAKKSLRLNILSMSNVDIIAKRNFFDPKKSVSDLVFMNEWGNKDGADEYIGFYGDMLWEALYAASLAPSYLNRQPYGFVIKDNVIYLVESADEYTDKIDGEIGIGVVMQHFAAVVGEWNTQFAWSIGEGGLEVATGLKVRASCRI